MVDTSLVLDAIVAVSIAAGAFFTIYQLQIMARDRQTEFIMRTSEFICAKDFQETLTKIYRAKSRDAKGIESEITYSELCRIADYFEGLSDLAERKLINEDLVLGVYALDVIWEKLKPFVDGERKELPFVWKSFEQMAKKRSAPMA